MDGREKKAIYNHDIGKQEYRSSCKNIVINYFKIKSFKNNRKFIVVVVSPPNMSRGTIRNMVGATYIYRKRSE